MQGIFPLLWLIYLPDPAPLIISIATVAFVGGVLAGVTALILKSTPYSDFYLTNSENDFV
jgi:hypothetical protein